MPGYLKRVRALAAAGVVALVVGVPAVAGAQTTVAIDSGEVAPITVPNVPTTAPAEVLPEVLGETVERPQPAEVLPQTVDSNQLAVTGTDIAGLAAIGAIAIGAGAVLITARRRARANA